MSSRNTGIPSNTIVIITVVTLKLFAWSHHLANAQVIGGSGESASARAEVGGMTRWLTTVQVVSEFYLGAGTFDKLDQVTPPPSGVSFDVGRSGQGFQFRQRVYVGPAGLNFLYDHTLDPLVIPLPRYGPAAESHASTRNLQLLLSVPIEFPGHHVRIEPLYGYGKTVDHATTDSLRGPGTDSWKPYDADMTTDGSVYGIESVVRFGQGIQLRNIFTYGDFEIIHQRLKFELMLSTDAAPRSEISDLEKDHGAVGFSLGLVHAWRDDGRREFQIFAGAMVRFGFPGLLAGKYKPLPAQP